MPALPKFITAPDIAKRLIDALAVGCYREEACNYAGIERTALARWIERGEAHQARTERYEREMDEWESGGRQGKEPEQPDPREEPYATIAAQIKSAEADARIAAVTAVRSAFNQPGGRGWVAAMTYLERKDPKKWGRTDRSVNLNVNVEATRRTFAQAVQEGNKALEAPSNEDNEGEEP